MSLWPSALSYMTRSSGHTGILRIRLCSAARRRTHNGSRDFTLICFLRMSPPYSHSRGSRSYRKTLICSALCFYVCCLAGSTWGAIDWPSAQKFNFQRINTWKRVQRWLKSWLMKPSSTCQCFSWLPPSHVGKHTSFANCTRLLHQQPLWESSSGSSATTQSALSSFEETFDFS